MMRKKDHQFIFSLHHNIRVIIITQNLVSYKEVVETTLKMKVRSS
jgi:hypothetical protein